MAKLFLNAFNLSISASWIVGVVLLLRFIFKKKIPKWSFCLLWGIVGLRLILPFSFESEISLLPSNETIKTEVLIETEQEEVETQTPQIPQKPSNNPSFENSTNFDDIFIDTPPVINQTNPTPPTIQKEPDQYINIGFEAIDKPINEAIAEKTEKPAEKITNIVEIAGIVWVCGMAVMLAYAIINYIILRNKVSEFIPEGNVRRCEKVGSPFILGVFRPKIYMPYGLSKSHEEMIIAHENAHLKRGDHFIKPFGFVLLSVYWFNPFIWLAYILLCRDIELACDEKVIKNLNADMRKVYAGALLECGVKRNIIAACPVAFGEIGVKTRVKNALNYKKPLFWVIVAAIVICSVVAVLFLTNPSDNNNDNSSSAPESSEASDDTSDTSSDTSSSTENKIVYSGKMTVKYNDYLIKLPDRQANEFLEVFNNGEWTKDIPEIVPEMVIYIDDIKIEYSTDNHRVYFVDTTNVRSLQLKIVPDVINEIYIDYGDDHIFSAEDVEVYTSSGDADMYLPLTLDELIYVYVDLLSRPFEEGTPDCYSDYMFVLSGDHIRYHSSCGTFIDENGEHLTITEQEKEKLNQILKTAMDEFADRNNRSISFKAFTFNDVEIIPNGAKQNPFVLNSEEDISQFKKIVSSEKFNAIFSNGVRFDEYAMIVAVGTTPAMGLELYIDDITVWNNTLTMDCKYAQLEGYGYNQAIDTVMYVAIVRKSDIEQCEVFEVSFDFGEDIVPQNIEFEEHIFRGSTVGLEGADYSKTITEVIVNFDDFSKIKGWYKDFDKFKENLPENFFDENALLVAMANNSSIGYNLSIKSVSVIGNKMQMVCQSAYERGAAYDTAVEGCLYIAVVKKDDVVKCKQFTSYQKEVAISNDSDPEPEPKPENIQSENYTFGNVGGNIDLEQLPKTPYVITNNEEYKAFKKLFTNNKLEAFYAQCKDDLFDKYAIVAMVSITPNPNMALSVSKVVKLGNTLTMHCQYADVEGYSEPDMVDIVMYLAIVKKSDIAGCDVFKTEMTRGETIHRTQIEFTQQSFYAGTDNTDNLKNQGVIIRNCDELNSFECNSDKFKEYAEYNFNEAFFEDYSLIVVKATTPNAGMVLNVKGVWVCSDKVEISCRYSYEEDCCYAEVVEKVLYVAIVDKDAVANATEVIIDHKQGEDIAKSNHTLSVKGKTLSCENTLALYRDSSDTQQKKRLRGDVNGDDVVDKKDYTILKRYCLDVMDLDSESLLAADINNDGTIDKKDYLVLKRHCLGSYNIPDSVIIINSISVPRDLVFDGYIFRGEGLDFKETGIMVITNKEELKKAKEEYNITSFNSFCDSLKSNFFDEYALLLVYGSSPCLDMEYSVKSVHADENGVLVTCEYAELEGNAYPTLEELLLFGAVVKKSDIAGCNKFRSEVVPGETIYRTQIEFTQHNIDVGGDNADNYKQQGFIIRNQEELANFNSESPEFKEYAKNNFDERFFKYYSLIVVKTTTPNSDLVLNIKGVWAYGNKVEISCSYSYEEGCAYPDILDKVLYVAIVDKDAVANAEKVIVYHKQGEDIVRDNYTLSVKGKTLSTANTMDFNKNEFGGAYVLLPFTHILTELGAEVNWQNSTTAIVTYDGISYTLDTAKCSMINNSNNQEILLPAPGDTMHFQFLGNEFLLDNKTAKSGLSFMGISVKIDVDYENHTVTIN